MPDTDPAAAYLAEVREREQAATPEPWALETDRGDDEYSTNPEFPYAIVMPDPHTEYAPDSLCGQSGYGYKYGELGEMTMGSAEFIVAARSDVPRLAAAVEAGLKPHQEHEGRCVTCIERCNCVGDAYGPLIGAGLPAAEVHRIVCEAWENCTHGTEPWPCEPYRAITTELLRGNSG